MNALLSLLLLCFQVSPQDPETQRKGFTLPEGYEIELVAADPELAKVVTIAFDDAGRMWAVTAVEYPVDANENPKQAEQLFAKGGRDRVLVFDTPTAAGRQIPRTWADGLAIPLGVLPWGDGALVPKGRDLLLLRDTDHDGKADASEVLLSGFGIEDSHLFPHQFTRGPGGWIYLAQGAFNYSRVRTRDGQTVVYNQTKMARFKPDGTRFEILSWGPSNIWGFVLTREGEMFIQEANDYGYPVMPLVFGGSYPGVGMHRPKPYAPWQPPSAPDFAMGGTGLSGLALSQDRDGFPAPWRDVMFVANPIVREVQAVRISPDGAHHRYEKLPTFLKSSDPMFRPIAIHFGPDGCLYVVDWYNKVISHNEVPRAHPDRDKTHGRVWRVRHSSQKRSPVPDLTRLPEADLLRHLAAPNTWEANAAWHQIADRKAAALAPALRAISEPPDLRIRALWALEGLGLADLDTLRAALGSPNRNVRREAVRILGARPDVLERHLDDPDPQVRAEVIRSLAAADPLPFALLLRMVRPPLDGPTVKSAFREIGTVKTGDACDRDFERYLVRAALETRPRALAEFLASASLTDETRAFAFLALEEKDAAAAIARTLGARAPTPEEALLLARQNAVGPFLDRPGTLEALLAVRQRFDPAPLRTDLVRSARALGSSELQVRVASAFRLRELEADVSAWTRETGRALDGLRALREMRAGSVDLFRELAASPDPQVRQEAVAALAAADGGLPALETLWPSLDPTLRRTAVDQLAGSRTRAQAFVDAVQAGRIARDVVDAAARDKLRAALGHDPFAEPGAPVVLRLSGGEEDAVDAAIDLDGPFTVETWIRLADGITNADGILCRRGGPDFNFHDARFRVWDGRSDRIIAQRPVTAGAWTHVAVTRDEKGDLRIYLDGEPDPAKGALPGPLRGLSIGLTNAAGGTAAELAEYRVWSVERTAGQVREHYNRSLAAQPGLAFHVPFGAAWARLKGRAENAAPSEPPPLLTEAELRKLERARALYDGPGDAAAGKAVFARTCLNCHTLRSEGGSIGPNLDGVGLREPSSLLAAIVTPSAAVESGYRLFRLRTNDGDVLDGLLVRESPQELVLRPVNGEERTIPRSRIQQSGFTRFSIMPEGLLDALSPKDAADLFAHLKAAGRPLDLVDATPETLATFFNGKDLSGWDGNTSLWRVEGGEIVGRTAGLKRNEFLRSRLVLGDFRLSLQVRMPLQNRGFENSGIQFRSKALPDGEMQGYQADIGPGWWGKLYEEHGRGLLWDQSGEAHVRANEWNAYEIVASGSRIRTSINGRPCVDLDDPKGARRGQIAFQLHSGGPTEIRFKDLKLELAP